MHYFSALRHFVILFVLFCSACGTAVPTIKPYKMDVQQGNVVTSKMLLQLRPGMTKSQVRFIMGTPLVQDSFHGNRWDYVYQMREAGKVIEQRRVILDFEKDLLKAVRGDVVPSGSAGSTQEESSAQAGTRVVQPYKKPEEKGLLSKLKFWEKDEAELAKKAAEKEAAAKAKAEALAKSAAEAEAKKTAVAPTAEEPKSILAVPLEATPVAPVAVPESAPLPPTASSPEVVAAQPETPKPAVKQVAPVVEANGVRVEESSASQALPPAEPVKPSIYPTESRLLFDRTLHSVTLEPEVKPADYAPRAGNKTVPKPKDFPPENEPSFFDRILERIGF
ncbi:MAG: outer membrane protein assembly factor BamE [Betaproteobacteria bacterium]|nr:outer membrane protein assembly factor BamE [Betaproteobacteria bacterium]